MSVYEYLQEALGQNLSPDEEKAQKDSKIDKNEESKIQKSIEYIKKHLNRSDVKDKIEKVEGGLKDAQKKINPKMFSQLIVVKDMVKDWVSGEYKGVPWETVLTLLAVLIYVVSPVDVIPDVVPVAGWIDDGWVISRLIPAMMNDIEKYQRWKEEKSPVGDEILDL